MITIGSPELWYAYAYMFVLHFEKIFGKVTWTAGYTKSVPCTQQPAEIKPQLAYAAQAAMCR
jgi:hypothetical protein